MIKNVMKYAVNYDKVVNYIYNDEDFITNKIIEYYKDFIINTKGNNKEIRSLDKLVNNYIDDDKFKRYVDIHINDFYTEEYGIDYYYDMNLILSKLFKCYKKNKTFKETKWL